MLNKSDQFSKELVEMAEFAKAISHPARIAIIKTLRNREKMFCGDIVDELPLSQPAVSRHLKELKEAGLLHDKPCGTKVCYSLNSSKLEKFCQLFSCGFKNAKNP